MLLVMILNVVGLLFLLIKPEKPFHLLYQPKSYSMVKNRVGESFDVVLLSSHKETFYLDPTYLSRSLIKNNDTGEQISVEIKKISVEDEPVIVEGHDYHYVNIECSFQVGTDYYELDYQDAQFELHYQNEEVISIAMGELYFQEQQGESFINVLEMVATHEDYHGLTVSGIYLEISHRYVKEISVIDLVLGTSVAKVNGFHSKEMYASIAYDDKLDTILSLGSYNHLKDQGGSFAYRVRRNQTKAMYFPLTYLREDLLLHRFYLKIIYEIDGEIKEEIVDDFPFIRERVIEMKKERFDVYYPRTYGEEFYQDIQESSSRD